jgi:lipid II:glycine glycyltransferase (peptidoglycan interpeptide bridge formation enzyme)
VITIDLTPPVDEILGNMSKTTRKSIRQAERRGVTIRGGDRADLSILWDLMMALCARRGVRSNVDNIEFMTHLWDVFSPGKRAQLFVAEVEQAPVAALLTIKAGDWIHLWRMGWSGAFPDKHPTKALLWHAAREAREEGCTVADLNWAESEVAEAIKAGDATSGNPNAGVTQYKLGFGGQVVRLPGAYTYFPNPIVRAFFRMGGERVVTSRLGARLLRGRRRLT